MQTRQNQIQPIDVAVDERRPAAEFLTDGHRRRVLQMRAADLDDIFEFFRFCVDRVARPFEPQG